MSVKFYILQPLQEYITKMNDSGVPVVCCGEKMTELIPGTSDGAHEKHVPAFEVNGNKVSDKGRLCGTSDDGKTLYPVDPDRDKFRNPLPFSYSGR